MAGTISAAEFYRQLNEGAVPEVLDLRAPSDAAAAPIVGQRLIDVRNVPVYVVMDELEAEADRVQDGAVVVCGQGNGSALVVDELAARGRRTRSLDGGIDAWGRLLVPVEVPLGPGELRTWQFQRPAKGCLSYVVGSPGKSCIVVDPARHVEAYLALADEHGMALTHVVETHLHADHISGGQMLADRVGATYHVPPEDVGPTSPYRAAPLHDGDELQLGGATVRVITLALPGHTPGSIALLVGEQLALVGDAVFVRGVGRPDLTGHADALARDLFSSLHDRLARQDPQTQLAPAHWSAPDEFDERGLVRTTLAETFATDLLRGTSVEEFVAEVVGTLPAAPPEYDTIRLVNAGLQTLAEEELEVLDVGLNRCAG